MKIPPRKPLSKAAIKILSNITPGNTEAIRRAMLRAVDECFLNVADGSAIDSMRALLEALCAQPDEGTRTLMGDAIRRAFGLLRMPLDSSQRAAMSETAHVIVTLPYTLSGSSAITSTQALSLIGGRIDSVIDNFRDPNGARLPGVVVSIPARDTTPADLMALNFMLSNPENRSADAEYGRWWVMAGQSTIVANQDAIEIPWFERMGFFYAFAMAVPGVTPLQSVSQPLTLTEYGNRVIDVIMTAVAEVNRGDFGLKIHLSDVCSLADGIMVSATNGLRLTLDSVARTIPLSRSAEVEHEPLARLIASLETTQDPPGQLLCSNFVGENGSYVANQRQIVPYGAPRAQLMDTYRKWASDHQLEFNELPPLTITRFPKNALGVYAMRDEAGVWRDPSILKVGPAAYDILRTGEWAIGWDEQFTSDEFSERFDAELRALPDPIRQEMAGLQTVINEHYTPAFVHKLMSVMRRPGLSREACFVDLDQEFGLDITTLIARGHAAQLLPSEQMYAAAHFSAVKGSLFVVRERLMSALHETDLSDDYPTEALRGPFPDCYFHFEKPLTVTFTNDSMFIEGFYLSEEITPPEDGEKEERRLTILPVVNSSADHLSFANQAMHWYCSPNDGKTLRETFERIDQFAADAGVPDAIKVGGVFKEFWRTMVKVLLYTTLPDFRQRSVLDRTNAVEAAKQRSGSSRHNAMKRAAHLYDYISIGPESDDEDDTQLSAPSGTHKKTHVRRGSYVWQPYGPGSSLRRTQWRRPTIVNIGHDQDPDPKTYKVG